MSEQDNVYKYCFDLWRNSNYGNDAIMILANSLQLSNDIIKSYIEIYINSCVEFRDNKKSNLKLLLYSPKGIGVRLYRKFFPNESLDIGIYEILNAVNKYCYDYCVSVNWNKENMSEMSKFLGVSSNEIISRARHYGRNNVIDYIENMHNEQINNLRQRYRNIPRNILYDKLCETDDEEEIIRLIDESGLEPWRLRSAAFNYVIQYKNDQKDTLTDELRKKIDIYSQYKKEIREKERLELKEEEELFVLDAAVVCVEKFIEGDYGRIEDFIRVNDIELKTFRLYVELVKKYDGDLYARYYEKVSIIRKTKYYALINNIKKIVFLIKNGVEENGKRRMFDLIDYADITGLSFDECLKVAKNANSNGKIKYDEFLILKNFILKNKECKPFSKKEINSYINSKIEIGSKLNKYGRPILNTGRIITTEEKKAVIKYLEFRQLPIDENTTALVLRRYVNGSIELFSNNKTRVRK